MKLLTPYYDTMSGRVLPYEKFRLFSDRNGGFFPGDGVDPTLFSESDRAAIIARAEKELDKPYPQVLASDFIRFYRDGNRSIFESQFFERRQMLLHFALAEAFEGKGRFVDRVMDGVWLVCDEADWVIHAHIPRQYPLTPYWKEHTYIDLFAAETGSTLAMVYMLQKKQLSAITPILPERIVYSLRQRIITPFIEHDMYWMGLDGRKVNNWNPWIVSNVLLVTALSEADTEIRERVVEKALRALDAFIDGYHSDGGCDEGPSYWTAAGASLFDALEILYDMTGGAVDIFGKELIRRMGEYEADFHINRDYFINFADCPAHLSLSYRLLARYGRRTGSERLQSFGAYYDKLYPSNPAASRWELYRVLKNMCEPIGEDVSYAPATQSWYDGICVMCERENPIDDKGFFLACKGGHNAESHNHNDVGSFIVYADGEPLLLDAGVGEYTKKTFSADRYKIWSMCSEYHNLPTVNGFGQLPGGKYRAEEVEYSADAHKISMNIAGAYPAEAGLESLRRTASLTDGVVTVTDAIRLSAPGSVTFTLMCARKPELTDSAIDFGDIVIEYSPELTAELDDFDMTMEDGSIKARWRGREIYRVLLKSGELTELTAQVKIRRK